MSSKKKWLVKLGEAQLLFAPTSYDHACHEVLSALSNNALLAKRLSSGELVFAEEHSVPLRIVSSQASFEGFRERQKADPISVVLAPLTAAPASTNGNSQSSTRSSRMKRAFLSMKESDNTTSSGEGGSRSPLRSRSPMKHHQGRSSAPPVIVVMVWGADVGRGAPIPFDEQQPPSYTELCRTAKRVLGQDVIERFVLRNSAIQAPDVDVEDEGDMATLISAVKKYGADALTLTAVGSSERLSLSRQARTPVKSKDIMAQQQSSSSLLTSPIAHREAPSPLVTRNERAKPAPSIVQQLD